MTALIDKVEPKNNGEAKKPEKRTHVPYSVVIVSVALIFLGIGIGIGLSQPYVSQSISKVTGPSQFTFVYGTVSLGPRDGGYPIYVYFYTTVIGTLSAGVGANG